MHAAAGVRVRPARPEDARAIAGLVAASEEAVTGRPSRVGPADVQNWLPRPDLENDTWLFEEDGELVAGAAAYLHGTLGIYFGRVVPAWTGRGLGAQIVELAEARLAGKDAARLHTWSLAGDAPAAALLLARGYREVRRFWEMAIELDGPPAEPPLPDGLALETFREAEARPFYQTMDEAFQDHWEHHPLPFEKWWEQKQRAPGYDPTLWYLVRAGGEIAAVVRNDPERSGGGLVAALGVRRAWRGKGLGRALLLRTFAEFWRRGVTRVTLGVDADNPTGATRLYESVGMHVELESVVYEKALA